MSLSSAFKSYGRVDPAAEEARLEARRRTCKRIAVIAVSLVILATVVAAAVAGTSRRSSGNRPAATAAAATSLDAVCDVTLYPDTCRKTLGQSANNATATAASPEDLLRLAIKVALDQLSEASKHFPNIGPSAGTNLSAAALSDCRELLADAIDDLASSVERAATASGGDPAAGAADLRTWLSSAGTCIETCLDGLDGDEGLRSAAAGHLKSSAEATSNGLAIVTWISKLAGSLKLRRLMELDGDASGERVWRRAALESSEKLRKKADMVVAKDGSGKYRTIGAALKAVKSKSKKRTVIYVKKGVYEENVRVEKNMWNVFMVGDGMDNTVVTGSLNVVDGTPTFSTATFAVFGKGFVGREMAFCNTAGPAKHQAVALMASADLVAFHRCRVDGYQDSLYAHSKRQFYRECDVYGTVDFIFGNAAAVLQNCRVFPRAPLPGQKNTITAQGRSDPNQNTGLALHNCSVAPLGSLYGVQTFLGRPWKNYSTTVFARSDLGGLVDPSGWLPWTGNSAPSTIYYAEYKNAGPGSSTNKRVNWKGLRKNPSREDVMKFSVTSFVQGEEWIHDTGVPYKPSI